ncbi:MAG: hypothetical protein WD711_09225 [Dongiaceae bacterium]
MLVIIGFTALLLLDVIVLMIVFRGPPDDMPRGVGSNAIWIEQDWVSADRDTPNYDVFAATLDQNGITDIFLRVGPLADDGTIDPEYYADAPALLAELKQRLPTLRAQAWIGDRDLRDGGTLDLADVAVRSRIAGTAATLLSLGFDGIHYDMAAIASGNRRFLALLDLTRPLIDAARGTLSVAAEIIEPLPGFHRPIARIFPDAILWSSDYYAAIAERADQLAVRLYDTRVPLPWAYSAIVAWTTPRIWESMAGGRADLLIGVPTHQDERGGFGAGAENLVSALIGVAHAMPSGGDAPSEFGLAVHSFGTTDETDWATWRLYWLGQPDRAD